MPNEWRTINSLVHKIRLHGRRGKGMAVSFSRQKSRHAPQKEGGLKILCDLPPVWPRLVRPTNLMSRMIGKKTHNTHTQNSTSRSTRERNGWILLATKIKARTAEGRWIKNPVWPSSCVTPAGTSNELDVQNEWEENTHTHTYHITAP